MADDKAKAIDLAVSQIEKQFGKGSIMRLGSKDAILPISVISTGETFRFANNEPSSSIVANARASSCFI